MFEGSVLLKAGKDRIRIWKCQTKSVQAGLKIKEFYKILIRDFKDPCSDTEHAHML